MNELMGQPAPDQVSVGSDRSASERAAALWREHRRWVAAVVYAYMPRGADVDDLLQEVAVNLLRHMENLRDTESIGPWLRTVAINVARDAGRRYQVRRNAFASTDVLARLDRSDRTEEERERGDAVGRGKLALEIAQELPTDYREPIFLSLRGLSYKQISQVLDLPVSTVETRLFRARAMVREELLRRDGGAEQRQPEADRPGGPFPFSSVAPGRRVSHD